MTNRSEIKALRTTAEDTLAYLKALTEQRVSFHFSGTDIDCDRELDSQATKQPLFQAPTYLSPAAHSQDLIIRYRGGDPDSERNRRSAARYVGLEIPTAAPLAPETAPEAFQEKYSSPLATRIGDMSRLTGVDNLKAQLYGMPGSYSEAAGAGAGAYKPLKTESQEPLSLRQAITSGPGPVAPRGVTGTAAQAVAAGAVGAVDAAGEAADGASATKNKGPLR